MTASLEFAFASLLGPPGLMQVIFDATNQPVLGCRAFSSLLLTLWRELLRHLSWSAVQTIRGMHAVSNVPILTAEHFLLAIHRVLSCADVRSTVRGAADRLPPCDHASLFLLDLLPSVHAQAWDTAVRQALDPVLTGSTFSATVSNSTIVESRDLSTAGMVEGYGFSINGCVPVPKPGSFTWRPS